ncbi:hypothetical protein AJ85_01170 [Alkalihalobacillus alcalophilus ATCC 27647 = CGMCC 1.3604]|uniref:Phosphate-specific transport system accessory protein PhoU n=1 Tax=Alkalihalobacillus alcalophilus ATCC 27647 = CGMCC 1.3604 TaxID=1218173 RepID=A0A094WP66_ALKAL|nr:phosphate signaling complex protein PhoU [Alkalihalobacillus alcalophilus]KGA98631.1 hypothetical protein BALCAV_0203105 [Alkalihalobacillus alcalophilus ATCC 27647 = CGMCC 1.3604]MED1562606.1 phosphate signaling complex protein PhoU [Alkalihalobacillus alcalophilus]THG91865.1 hypothetical protein AJ85_01170 [Alkalihalobacillus alcalophilus ATCC 27647 = CGMCC 1.3604]
MRDNLQTFTHAIHKVEKKIIRMAELTRRELELAVDSLVSKKEEKSHKVLELDLKVDDFDYKIHSSILELLMIQPPLPKELQALTTMNRISREYERIGDQAVNIADLGKDTSIRADSQLYMELKEMCRLTCSMLKGSMEVVQNKNLSQAKEIAEQDDIVDNYFHQIHLYIVSEMRRNTEQIESLANLLLVTRYLERSADHVVNVTRQIEKVTYLIE